MYNNGFIDNKEKQEDKIALLKLLEFSKADVKKGKVISSNSFKERLANLKVSKIE